MPLMIMMMIAAALIQCMMRTANGCIRASRRTGGLAGECSAISAMGPSSRLSAPVDRYGLGSGQRLAHAAVPGRRFLKPVGRHLEGHDRGTAEGDALDRDRHQACAEAEQAAERH